MQSESFSPKESLKLIDSMINQAQNRFSENGFLYLLWGWLVFFVSIAHFLLLKLQLFKHPEIVWASCWLAAIFQFFYLSKRKKNEKVSTYSENMIKYIWINFLICMLVVTVIVGKTNNWNIINSLILLFYGTPTFLSGIAMRFRPLVIGGIICWVLAMVSVFVPPIYVLLLLSVAVASAWIVPGYLLRQKYHRDAISNNI